MKYQTALGLWALLTFSSTYTGAVQYVDYYKGLPNYDEQPAFIKDNQKAAYALHAALAKVNVSSRQCKVGVVNVWKDWKLALKSNICDARTFKALRGLVSQLAPGLRSDRTTLWLTDLGANSNPDLIVGHIDLSQDQYPHLSLWRLRLENGAFKALYAGPFLDGEIYAVRPFGANPKRKIVFVKHVSCIECEPITYLTGIDFDADNDARPFAFTYSEAHGGFESTIEYALPGMGHTVDAKVETRTLPPSVNGPHLLQFFKMDKGEGPDEWWAFTCKDYRCDYEMYKKAPPAKFFGLWKRAKRL